MEGLVFRIIINIGLIFFLLRREKFSKRVKMSGYLDGKEEDIDSINIKNHPGNEIVIGEQAPALPHRDRSIVFPIQQRGLPVKR